MLFGRDIMLSERVIKLSEQVTYVVQTRYYVGMGGGRVVRWSWGNFQCWGVLQFG